MLKDRECLVRVPVVISLSELTKRLDRVAEALYPLLTSSVSSKNLAKILAENPASSIHLHETLKTRALVCLRDAEMDNGKNEPKTAA